MIRPMLRVEVAALKEVISDLLHVLHAEGVLHIEPLVEVPPALEGRLAPRRLSGEEDQERQTLATVDQRVKELTGPGEEIAEAGLVAQYEVQPTSALVARAREIAGEIHNVEARRDQLIEEKRLLPHFERLVTAFFSIKYAFERRADWAMMGLVLEREWVEAIEPLKKEIAEATRGHMEFSLATLDARRLVAVVFYDQRFEPELEKLVWSKGIEHLSLPQRYLGKPLEDVTIEMAARGRELPACISEAEEACRRVRARAIPELLAVGRAARLRLEELAARTAFLQSQYTVALAGWVPEGRAAALRAALESRIRERVLVNMRRPRRDEWASVPVALDNPVLAQPFELLLRPLQVPRYGSLDPTVLLALFFPVFFGLMVGDIGHGALIALAGIAVRRLFPRWPSSVSALLLTMGGSSIVFGILFGEFFGDLAKGWLDPLWFDRSERMMTFLLLALSIGVVHITLGFVLGVVEALRHEEHRRVAERVASALALLGGLVLVGAATRLVPEGWFTPGLVLMIAMIPVLLYAGGVLALLELITTAGHVLSYARLMALGLAGAMLAHVANSLGSAAGNVVLGALIAVLLHVLHLAMSLFSPTIQALRLHYVEFFSKFYEAGGIPYSPFRK